MTMTYNLMYFKTTQHHKLTEWQVARIQEVCRESTRAEGMSVSSLLHRMEAVLISLSQEPSWETGLEGHRGHNMVFLNRSLSSIPGLCGWPHTGRSKTASKKQQGQTGWSWSVGCSGEVWGPYSEWRGEQRGLFWMGTWRVRASGNQEWLDTGTLACTAGAREGGHTEQALRNRRVHGRQQWSP